MAKIPIEKFNLQTLIDNVWKAESKPYRSSNIGASAIGYPCLRSTFLTFRWVSPPEDISGKMLRLFNVGAREEDIMVENLKKVGFDIMYTGKEQLKMQIAPHLVCKPDGVIFGGLPEQEGPVNFECKTMNLNNYDKLEKQGLKNAKPEYYDQAQCEMYGESIELSQPVTSTLFVALCKDDSRIYAEIIRYDEGRMNIILKNTNSIVFGEDMPEEYSIDPTMGPCKYCSNSVFCHVSHETREVNCRTCIFSKPEKDSTWTCGMFPGSPIPYEVQIKGCKGHAFNPLFVPYEVEQDRCTKWNVAYRRSDGEIILNGLNAVSSKDLWKHMVVENVDDGANPLDITF